MTEAKETEEIKKEPGESKTSPAAETKVDADPHPRLVVDEVRDSDSEAVEEEGEKSQAEDEETETSEEESLEMGQKPSGVKKFILIGLVVILFLALIGGGILVYRRAVGGKGAESFSGATQESESLLRGGRMDSSDGGISLEEATPTPSPASGLKREDLKIQILNGSGVAGAAGEAKELLEDLGYKDIDTGNADSYDHEETEISIKKDKKDYLEQLTDDLSEKYTLSAEEKTLDEGAEFDALVVVGKE